MTTLAPAVTRPPVNTHRARIVGDAVISAYIRELAAQPEPAPVPQRRELRPRQISREQPVRSRKRGLCAIDVRRWAPARRQHAALEPAA